jgi:hypothetical protein
MHSTVKLIEAAVPWLTPQAHAVLVNLALRNGHPGPANEFAVFAGFRNRFQLVRLLQREALPNLEELAGWVRIIAVVHRWEASGTSLFRAAYDSGHDPRSLHKTIQRLTKRPWSEVRGLGSAWVVLQLLQRCEEIRAL